MTEKIKAHCPNCDGERNCQVHGSTEKPWSWDDDQGFSINGSVCHSLMECLGCETVFYHSSSWNTEDLEPYYDMNNEVQYEVKKETTTYPKPDSKQRPVWLELIRHKDGVLYSILDQLYISVDNKLNILTAIGLRTALDRGTEVLGIDPKSSFQEKLTALKNEGWIGETEKKILEVVTEAGSAAVHRGWLPDEKTVNQLLYAMDVFLQRAFIVAESPLELMKKIPTKPKRPRDSSN